MRVLAVDDEPIFLSLLDAALKDLGFNDVTTVYSAVEALRELECGPEGYDCILLDIRMPGMNGIELCKRIRSMVKYRRVPILMITAMVDKNFIESSFAAGATDYLTKPIDEIELRARMSVMQRLVAEQLRNQILEMKVAATDGIVELKFDLDTPVNLQGFERVIEYLALENYLLSLSVKGSYYISSFAISITNAAMLFSSCSRINFMNMLCDVASCIEDALKSVDGLIAYAGNGKFVVVTNSAGRVDAQMIEDIICLEMLSFEKIYEADGMDAPRIEVGPEVQKTLFSRVRPQQLLNKALTAVERPKNYRSKFLSQIA